jgi:hypothetical protein
MQSSTKTYGQSSNTAPDIKCLFMPSGSFVTLNLVSSLNVFVFIYFFAAKCDLIMTVSVVVWGGGQII